MRIAELSRASGVPAATIKYYVREGLLPSGVRTHRNQAEYSDAHVGRLRLIRALVDIGGVSIEAAKELLAALDSGSLSARDALGHVQYALGGRRSPVGDERRAAAADDVAALLDRRGWRIEDDSPALGTLVDVCAALRLLGHDEVVAALDDYASASEAIAVTDIALVRDEPGLERMTETAIVGTILGDTLLAALRRLAQEHLSSTLLPPDDASGEV
ncbi:MerR family transcriptional regulator [Nocardia implantans]|uniref:MerR family transcriptional regulator n=1 Tax=Nocardia implantans TaxID=3108168 RepID=A0ABU6AST5_9NOCA|nr:MULTISPECIES: MerR family transcriptional regulator [unclassified Nocardia]MBF6190884.1 MerR family transcriptional regulator [Nocardia beijingensis]MEA3528874.1 MerR family transcriptional regulator [Nocardia sp. CDC192]MEB3510539.1 MerR family transcriptional regulator [Nocardia sp. CDC186]